tara:strand:- start:156 stop:698 length:543 start_codon:yes stop_codon:yes gene_type:complete
MSRPLLLAVSLEEIQNRQGRMSEHVLYNTWRGMKERCLSVSCIAHKRYGGKGINIHQDWIDKTRHFKHKRWSRGFCLFLDYIEKNLGPKPLGFSLDRINGNYDYAPNNLRWADPSLQKKNQTVKNRTGYKYVYAVTGSSKWQAEYKNGKERIHLGYFITKEKAYSEALAHRLETLWPKNL